MPYCKSFDFALSRITFWQNCHLDPIYWQKYKIIKKVSILIINTVDNPIFMGDSAPCHRAKKVKDLISEKGIEHG